HILDTSAQRERNLGPVKVGANRRPEACLHVHPPGASRTHDQMPFDRLAIDAVELTVDVRLDRRSRLGAIHVCSPPPPPSAPRFCRRNASRSSVRASSPVAASPPARDEAGMIPCSTA